MKKVNYLVASCLRLITLTLTLNPAVMHQTEQISFPSSSHIYVKPHHLSFFLSFHEGTISYKLIGR